jgi:hypothetical protein
MLFHREDAAAVLKGSVASIFFTKIFLCKFLERDRKEADSGTRSAHNVGGLLRVRLIRKVRGCDDQVPRKSRGMLQKFFDPRFSVFVTHRVPSIVLHDTIAHWTILPSAKHGPYGRDYISPFVRPEEIGMGRSTNSLSTQKMFEVIPPNHAAEMSELLGT